MSRGGHWMLTGQPSPSLPSVVPLGVARNRWPGGGKARGDGRMKSCRRVGKVRRFLMGIPSATCVQCIRDAYCY